MNLVGRLIRLFQRVRNVFRKKNKNEDDNTKIRYVVVDGNIGVGKSTMLAKLSEHYHVLPEPVDEWCSPISHLGEIFPSPLETFYSDPINTALAFQIHVLSSRVKQLTSCANKDGKLMVIERDPFDMELFVKQSLETGGFTPLEYESFKSICEEIPKAFGIEHVGSVYLRLDPTTCYERIRKRSRGAEDKLDMDHIRRMHDLHEAKYSAISDVITCTVIDGNKSEDDCVKEAIEFLNKHTRC
ncbi:deoxynucleoside kinase [Tetraselmis virus 1]|uniref:Deoxynucleoside kinase n=1 Tax=Tetraselmis virus 1 TaxID=2060617 RepID=A0A2P0VN82_9VIRU|nr:deoxynucleoside kinase [Tetraselmis virus 1]AUF82343.1 deoxynucleoside kinase [Tetraselmis virus 1]